MESLVEEKDKIFFSHADGSFRTISTRVYQTWDGKESYTLCLYSKDRLLDSSSHWYESVLESHRWTLIQKLKKEGFREARNG